MFEVSSLGLDWKGQVFPMISAGEIMEEREDVTVGRTNLGDL